MAEDVEMTHSPQSQLSPLPEHPPPPFSSSSPPSSRSSSTSTTPASKPIPISGSDSISIPLVVHSPSPSGTATVTTNNNDSASGDAAAVTNSDNTDTDTKVTANTAPPPPITTTSKPASSSAKPKSTKHTKPRSPSPTPPPPIVPLKTVRLEIKLGGPSNYEVDIMRQAKNTGQCPPTPPLIAKKHMDSSDSEDDDDEEDQSASHAGKRLGTGLKRETNKAKKKKKSSEYDTSDPFIDDSELAVDQRQFFAQTKQQGFYVSSGEVALLKDKTPKKPKSKKISFATGLHPSLSFAATTPASISAPVPSLTHGTSTSISVPGISSKLSNPILTLEGTRDAPIPIDDDSNNTANGSRKSSIVIKHELPPTGVSLGADAQHVGQKRKRQANGTDSVSAPVPPTGGGKRKKVIDESTFHPDLQVAIQDLKKLVAKESWEQKGKFPPGLKPPLAKLAILAIRLDEYDEDFFSLMPTLFPYNKFTMTKLIKRTIFPEHIQLLTDRQEVLLAQLKQLADEGFEKAKEEWEKAVVAWDKRQEKSRHEQEAAEASGSGTAPPTRQGTEEMDVDDGPPATQSQKGGGKDKDKEGGGKDANQHPPARRYRMTDQMKVIVWELVLLSNECCRLENEKNSLDGSTVQISDQGLRKVLYQKIVSAYPEGWMSSGQISRDVSAMKKRLEREQMEQENDD